MSVLFNQVMLGLVLAGSVWLAIEFYYHGIEWVAKEPSHAK